MIPPVLRVGLRVWWAAVLAFLYAPLAVVVVLSFNKANTAAYFSRFSLHWYGALFADAPVMGAIENSVILALVSSSLATVMGTMLGYGLYRHRHRRLAWLLWLVYLPIVMPDIVYGVADMGFFTTLDAALGVPGPGLTTMTLAHVSFQIPFVCLLIHSRLVGLDPAAFEACRDLYGAPWQRARYFVLPVLASTIIAAFCLAFTLSIDDFVISFFTAGPESTTLPIYVWSAIRKGITPEINAVATLMIVGALTMAAIGLAFHYARVLRFARRSPRTAGAILWQ